MGSNAHSLGSAGHASHRRALSSDGGPEALAAVPLHLPGHRGRPAPASVPPRPGIRTLWEHPATPLSRRAIGSLLIVDSAWSDGPPSAIPLHGDAAVMPLSGPAVLVSALCPDGLALRRSLDSGLALLEADAGAAAKH
jgi:hypothetical protein